MQIISSSSTISSNILICSILLSVLTEVNKSKFLCIGKQGFHKPSEFQDERVPQNDPVHQYHQFGFPSSGIVALALCSSEYRMFIVNDRLVKIYEIRHLI